MREIKFRAWTKDGMDYNVGVCPSEAGIQTYILNDESCEYWPYYDQPKFVMQYTGLKDKNGKEIYEGDVVVTLYDHFEEGMENTDKYVIEFGKGSNDSGCDGYEYQGFICRWLGRKKRDDDEWWSGIDGYGHLLLDEDVQVIGNIYQDSHLLKNNG